MSETSKNNPSESVQCLEPDISVIDLTPQTRKKRSNKPGVMKNITPCKCPKCDAKACEAYFKAVYPRKITDKPNVKAMEKKIVCKLERHYELDEEAMFQEFLKNEIEKG